MQDTYESAATTYLYQKAAILTFFCTSAAKKISVSVGVFPTSDEGHCPQCTPAFASLNWIAEIRPRVHSHLVSMNTDSRSRYDVSNYLRSKIGPSTYEVYHHARGCGQCVYVKVAVPCRGPTETRSRPRECIFRPEETATIGAHLYGQLAHCTATSGILRALRIEGLFIASEVRE